MAGRRPVVNAEVWRRVLLWEGEERLIYDDQSEVPTATPQDLRDTAASLAVAAGASVKAVQRMLGHGSAAMTLDVYARLFDEELDDVADRMGTAADALRSREYVSPEQGPEAPLAADEEDQDDG